MVLKELWRLLRENGVEVPFPQRDINVRSGTGEVSLASPPAPEKSTP